MSSSHGHSNDEGHRKIQFYEDEETTPRNFTDCNSTNFDFLGGHFLVGGRMVFVMDCKRSAATRTVTG